MVHGPTLPVQCRLVMPNGVGWTVGLVRMENGTRFQIGWREFVDDNIFKHGDFMTISLVDVGTFHIKRYDVSTGVPPLTDDYVYAPNDNVPTTFVATIDDYQPSYSDTDSSDDSGYEDDHDALDLDGRPTFTVTVTASHIARTFEVPYGF
ncbi:B3 domain-containing protein REM20-like [Salvia splendens]|uniref:B3 domain-containing protein REM20-like n=1 Tax=Salvia splendens TaxID=180675 RepID=UPI001C273D12|nr:B3 domain-containing protein REM20-like [Salvia splendens]